MEGKGKSSASRLFSPPFPGNATYCLSFFFTMAYNSPNSTLTVYRLVVISLTREKNVFYFYFQTIHMNVTQAQRGSIKRVMEGYCGGDRSIRQPEQVTLDTCPCPYSNSRRSRSSKSNHILQNFSANLVLLIFSLMQSLVIEGSTDSGGIGLDDIRFRQVPCSSKKYFIYIRRKEFVKKVNEFIIFSFSSSLKS